MTPQDMLADQFVATATGSARWRYGCSARRQRPTTPSRRPGSGWPAPTSPRSRTWAAGSRPCVPGSASTTSARVRRVARTSWSTLPVTKTPEDDAVLSDSVGVAMMVVLDTLAPAERLSIVLHDMFAVPFDEIGGMLGRTSMATRQLASRARRRVQSSEPPSDADRARQREVVTAFLAASREGDFEALVALLHRDAAVRADAATVARGAEAEVVGANAVATTFSGRAKAAHLALFDGYAGAVWSMGGHPRVVFGFTIEEGRIVEIELLGDPDVLPTLDLETA